jgi:hypothetical protein
VRGREARAIESIENRNLAVHIPINFAQLICRMMWRSSVISSFWRDRAAEMRAALKVPRLDYADGSPIPSFGQTL